MQAMAEAERIDAMAVTIEARRLALGLTVQDLIEQTGLDTPRSRSPAAGRATQVPGAPHVADLPGAQVDPRLDRPPAVGPPPIELEPVTQPDELAALREQVADLTALVTKLAASVESLGAEVAQLRGQPPRPALGTP